MSPGPGNPPDGIARSALETEIGQIVDALDAQGVPLRVLGSLGVSLHCPISAPLLPAFARTYADIDFAGYRRHAATVSALLASIGYVEDREVAITSEGRRGLYDHPATGIHVDVFYDRLEFCHPIPLDGRLERDTPTVPLAELLLSKLQIVKINEKDVVDIILLLLDHELADADAGTIDIDRIARLCAADWGLWRTTTLNLDKVSTLAQSYPQLDSPRRERVSSQLTALTARLAAEPKSLGWRARARIGERVKWWTDVDEVH
ncbi:MAG: hypothetical protein ACRDFZ_08020 [Candidatus Limnocylindria bacterium]